jgi:hypothetical protein
LFLNERGKLIMKKLVLILLGILIIGFGALPGHAFMATFNPPDDPIIVNVGDSFGVEVFAQGSFDWGDLTGFGFDVDPFGQLSNISFNSYTIGPGFDDWGSGSFVSGVFDPFSFPPNAGQNVLLATLSFTALSIGTDTLQIEGIFSIPSNSGLFYENRNESIEGHTNISVVPAPATILLLSSGLLGLAGIKRKFKKS